MGQDQSAMSAALQTAPPGATTTMLPPFKFPQDMATAAQNSITASTAGQTPTQGLAAGGAATATGYGTSSSNADGDGAAAIAALPPPALLTFDDFSEYHAGIAGAPAAAAVVGPAVTDDESQSIFAVHRALQAALGRSSSPLAPPPPTTISTTNENNRPDPAPVNHHHNNVYAQPAPPCFHSSRSGAPSPVVECVRSNQFYDDDVIDTLLGLTQFQDRALIESNVRLLPDATSARTAHESVLEWVDDHLRMRLMRVSYGGQGVADATKGESGNSAVVVVHV